MMETEVRVMRSLAKKCEKRQGTHSPLEPPERTQFFDTLILKSIAPISDF